MNELHPALYAKDKDNILTLLHFLTLSNFIHLQCTNITNKDNITTEECCYQSDHFISLLTAKYLVEVYIIGNLTIPWVKGIN